MQAITLHGAIKGSYLTIKRLLRCHPFHNGDMDDPVPKKLVSKNGEYKVCTHRHLVDDFINAMGSMANRLWSST